MISQTASAQQTPIKPKKAKAVASDKPTAQSKVPEKVRPESSKGEKKGSAAKTSKAGTAEGTPGP